jgi:hypothetical protein
VTDGAIGSEAEGESRRVFAMKRVGSKLVDGIVEISVNRLVQKLTELFAEGLAWKFGNGRGSEHLSWRLARRSGMGTAFDVLAHVMLHFQEQSAHLIFRIPNYRFTIPIGSFRMIIPDSLIQDCLPGRQKAIALVFAKFSCMVRSIHDF